MKRSLFILLSLITSLAQAQPPIEPHTTKDDGLKGKVKKVTATTLLERLVGTHKFHTTITDLYDAKGLKTHTKHHFIATDGKDTLYTRTITYTFKNGLPDTYERSERHKGNIVQKTFSKYYYDLDKRVSHEEGYSMHNDEKMLERNTHRRYGDLMITEEYEGSRATEMKLVRIDTNRYINGGKMVNTDSYTFIETDDNGAGEFRFSYHNTYIDSAGYEMYRYYDADSTRSGSVHQKLDDGRLYNILRYTNSDTTHYQHTFHDIDKQGNYLRVTETSPGTKEVTTYKIEYYQ